MAELIDLPLDAEFSCDAPETESLLFVTSNFQISSAEWGERAKYWHQFGGRLPWPRTTFLEGQPGASGTEGGIAFHRADRLVRNPVTFDNSVGRGVMKGHFGVCEYRGHLNIKLGRLAISGSLYNEPLSWAQVYPNDDRSLNYLFEYRRAHDPEVSVDPDAKPPVFGVLEVQLTVAKLPNAIEENRLPARLRFDASVLDRRQRVDPR